MYRDTLKQKLHGYDARRLKDAIERQLKSAQTLEKVAAEGHNQRHAIAVDVLRDRAFAGAESDAALFDSVADEYNLDCLQALARDIADVIEPEYEFDGIVVDATFVVRDPHLVVTKVDGDVALAICFASEPYATDRAVQAELRGAGYTQFFGDVNLIHGQTWIKKVDDFAYHLVEVTGGPNNRAYIHGGYVYLRDTDPQYIKSACKTMDTQRQLRRVMESDAMPPAHRKEIARRFLAHDLFHYGGFSTAYAQPDLPETFGGMNWHFVQAQLPTVLSY